MIRPPPRSTRTDTLFPSTTLFRSGSGRLPGFLALGGEADVGRPEACDKGVDLVGGRLFAICPDGQRRAYRKGAARLGDDADEAARSEEHTSELQSLMRTPYAVFCLKKKT